MVMKKAVLAGIVALMLNNVGATVLNDVPASPDTNGHYLFFLHGLFPALLGNNFPATSIARIEFIAPQIFNSKI